MKLRIIEYNLAVCKINSVRDINMGSDFYFIGKTDDEVSLVCIQEDIPENFIECENDWRAFCIDGVLDFSLVGILSRISGILAESKIGIFAVSTFNTDYILIKEKDFCKAIRILEEAGYQVV